MGGQFSPLNDNVPRDKETPVIKTPSINPQWFQSMAETPETKMTVKQVQNAVKKALAGKKLGIRQHRVITAMLDQITGERTDPKEMAYVREELARRRELRKQVNQPESEDWTFSEDEYSPEMDGTSRHWYEMLTQARAISEETGDKAEAILDSQADDETINAQLGALLNESGTAGAAAPRTEEGETGPQAESRTGEEDLAGPVNKQAQAVADAQRAKDEARNGQESVPVESGEFFGPGGEGRLEEDLLDQKLRPNNRKNTSRQSDLSLANLPMMPMLAAVSSLRNGQSRR